MPKNPEAEAPVAPVEAAASAPAPSPSEAAITASVANPEVLNKDTVIDTNRAPFEGTKVETNDQVQERTQEAASFETVDLGNGTILTSYTGVQPGVVLTNRTPSAE